MVRGFLAGILLSMSKDTQLIRSIAWAHRKNWKPPGRTGFARLSSGLKGKVPNSKANHEPPNLSIRLRSQVARSQAITGCKIVECSGQCDFSPKGTLLRPAFSSGSKIELV